MYKLEFKKSVKKDLKNIDKARVKKILREIDGLKNGIKNNDNVIKLKGNNPYYRFRIGEYRVIFEKQDNILIITVIKIGHRKDIYQNFT